MSSHTRLEPGYWVRVDKAPRGWITACRQAYAARVVEVRTTSVVVELYDRRGNVTHADVRVPIDDITVLDLPPVFRNRTSHIAETAEIKAAKELIWDTAMDYGRRHSLCGVLQECLTDIGIQEPPPGKVKAKLVIEVDVEPTKLIKYANYRTVGDLLKAMTSDEQARTIFRAANLGENVEVEFEVFPPAGIESAEPKAVPA